MNRDFYQGAEGSRKSGQRARTVVHTRARRLTETAPPPGGSLPGPYPNAAYAHPGRGVSGESSN